MKKKIVLEKQKATPMIQHDRSAQKATGLECEIFPLNTVTELDSNHKDMQSEAGLKMATSPPVARIKWDVHYISLQQVTLLKP